MRWCCVAVVLVLVGCRELGLVESPPHAQYQHRLDRAGLLDAPLGADWMQAAAGALRQPVAVSLPYRETGYFAAERPRAAGYRVELRRGQRLVINVGRTAGAARIFADLFLVEPGDDEPRRVASADSALTGMVIEIERDGVYILRLQPELLRPARYVLTILGNPSMGMPVSGAVNRDIKSEFGVDRDAGRRRHEGIDIFAPRGTPVLAATQGRITDVGENNLGGNVIWQWDPVRNQSLYYAHLDRQLAHQGQEVQPGDTIALVGNTGNARTTPPHLHFGIYRRGGGAIDPLPYVYRGPRQVAPVTSDSADLGALVRVRRAATLLGSAGPDTALSTGTIMRVAGASGARYRVETAEGVSGFVAVSAVEVTPDSAISNQRR